MRKREKHGISEAKKAPFKVHLGTEAFLASEMPDYFAHAPGFFAHVATSFFAQETLRRWREIQLIGRAVASLGLPTLNDDAGAARLNC